MNIQGKIAAQRAAQDLTKEIDQATDAAVSNGENMLARETPRVVAQGLGRSGLSGLQGAVFSEKMTSGVENRVEQKNSSEMGPMGRGEGREGSSEFGPQSYQAQTPEAPSSASGEANRPAESDSKTGLETKTYMEAEKSQTVLPGDSERSEGHFQGEKTWVAGRAPEMFALPGVEQKAEAELQRDEVEITQPEDFVGEESKLQVEERLAEDREDLQQELDVETGKARLTKGQERLTDEAVRHIEEVISKTADQPGKLEEAWFSGMTKFIENSYGRKFGDRN